MNILQIWNPVSGRGKASQCVPLLTNHLQRAGHIVHTHRTHGPGDAQAVAADVSDDIDVVIVAGGDGTLNEVINGLKSPLHTPIAILPMGGANIVARDLAIPYGADNFVNMIDQHDLMHIDLGIINSTRRFCVMASAGIDATIVKSIARKRDIKLGMRGYLAPILKAAFNHAEPRLNICVDGGTEMHGAAALVMNTRTYAGILTASSTASFDSGMLSVVILPATRIANLVRYGFAGLWRDIGQCTDAMTLTGTHVSIRSDNVTDVQIDGEYFRSTPVDIDILPRAAAFLVPKKH